MPTQHNIGGAASLLEFDSSIPYEIFKRNLKLLRVGQVIVDFEIILEKNRVIFYGSPNKHKSRTVRGKVRLEVAGKLNVKEIMITLAGEFHIANENAPTFASDEIPLQGTLFSTCILLANKRTLNPGVHEFYFEFSLPGDLPESMSSDLVLCEYFLKAEIVARGLGDLHTRNKVVDVVDLFVQRSMLQSDDDVKQGLDATRYTGSRDKILDFEFLLPKILRLNTDVLTFHARWDGLRVDNVTFLFVQTESFTSLQAVEGQESSSDRKTKVISGPFRFDMPRKEPLKLQSRPMTFQLPITEPFVRDYDLYNVEIRHQLIISIQMANKNKESIQLCIPIMIESIVESMETIPLPCHISQSNQAAFLHFANKTYRGKPLEDNNPPEPPSLNRFARAEQREHSTIVDDSNESTAVASESIQTNEQTLQVPRRTSSIIIRKNSTNNSNHNDVNVINIHHSISTINESASEFTVDEISNENSNTIATTVTFTNNAEHERNSHGFPQKGSQKSTFVINSGNVIAEKFTKFNHLLQRNRSNNRSISVSKKGANRPKRAASSASAAKFAPGLLEFLNRLPNANTANANASLTT